MRSRVSTQELPEKLRLLVRRSVARLGETIRKEAGEAAYAEVERLRRSMTHIRDVSSAEAARRLRHELAALSKLSDRRLYGIAHSFALMLELMNACENAYRAFRLRSYERPRFAQKPEAMIYVVTAHPTEARAPVNIGIFHAIQRTLVKILARDSAQTWEGLDALLVLAWRLPITRSRRPRVADEADSIYSILLRDETLEAILAARRELGPIYVRSWVGGDKDGHPGVNEQTMRESLGLSRARLLAFTRSRLNSLKQDLAPLRDRGLSFQIARAEQALRALSVLRSGDGRRVLALHRELKSLARDCLHELGVLHPALLELGGLRRMFPAFCVPLELRESSDLVTEAVHDRGAPISRMLRQLALISGPADPRFYARGLIISMADSPEHMRAACRIVQRELGGLRLPVIPLFEQAEALRHAPAIVSGTLKSRALRQAVKRHWDGFFEVMLGYSDSAKEMGSLPSRLAIADCVGKLDRELRRRGVCPLFFHGSGGSTDRGGGPIEEQTAWLPASARRLYKATIQGEMVERTLASPEITYRRFEQIASQAQRSGGGVRVSRGARRFAALVEKSYKAKVSAPEFLEVVERATTYPYLSALKIGSRPAKRGSFTSVSALRAIPWVLCWTQARVLFPSWWGVGSAWRTGAVSLRALRRSFATDPVFRSYVKLLGFTLARIELPIFQVMMERSTLEPECREAFWRELQREHKDALAFVRAVSGEKRLIWYRPWLEASIRLRSVMIHPLNLVQMIALERKQNSLIRETVTGIASGMVTTG